MGLAEIVHVELEGDIDPLDGQTSRLDDGPRGAALADQETVETGGVQRIEVEIERAYLVVADVGDDAAERARYSRIARHDGPLQADAADHRADVQCPAAAEGKRHESAGVVAAFDRHEPDGAGHFGVGNTDDGFCRRDRIQSERPPHMLDDGVMRRLRIEPGKLAADGPLAVDAPEHEIGVRQRRSRIALAVAGGSRPGARALGTYFEQPPLVDVRNGPAAGADGGDLDHGRADDEAEVDGRLRRQRRLAVGDQRDVEGRAAEIGGDHVRIARAGGDGSGCDHAGGRTRHGGADRKAPGGGRRHHPAVRLHDVERAPERLLLERSLELGEVAADDRLQIGVERRRRRALELAYLGQDLGGDRDVLVGPEPADDARGRCLVLGAGVGVDEADGYGLRAPLDELPRRGLHIPLRQGNEEAAVGEDPLVDLEPQVAIDNRPEVPLEPPGHWPVAAAHLNNVAEALGRHEADARALPLEKRVGASCRAVHDRLQRADRRQPLESLDEARGLIAAVRRHLGDGELPPLAVVEEEVRERPPDIDADDLCHPALPAA